MARPSAVYNQGKNFAVLFLRRRELAGCAALLAGYAWPGNVRALRNMMERVALLMAAESLQALSPSLLLAVAPEFALRLRNRTDSGTVGVAICSASAPTALPIDAVHAPCNGNRAAAARRLGISRTTLWRKLQSR